LILGFWDLIFGKYFFPKGLGRDKEKAMQKIIAVLAMACLVAWAWPAAVFSKAKVDQYTYTVELTDFPVLNQCNGESLLADGTARYVYKLVTDAQGGLHYVWHGTHNLRGIGESTGTVYQVISSFTEEGNLPEFSFPYEWTRVNTSPLIAHGGVSDMVFTIREHLTINANGEMVVTFSDVAVDCK
jgi:hypothetical protein